MRGGSRGVQRGRCCSAVDVTPLPPLLAFYVVGVSVCLRLVGVFVCMLACESVSGRVLRV